MKPRSSKNDLDLALQSHEASILGQPWVPIYQTGVEFKSSHFEAAMLNLIKNPNINSTVIMRGDILKENHHDPEKGFTSFVSKFIDEMPEFPSDGAENDEILISYFDDTEFKNISLDESKINLKTKYEILRRIIPRNPYKDHIINQTCHVMTSDEADDPSTLVIYIPHIKTADETPFYLPPMNAIGILYHKSTLSIHYVPFKNETISLDPTDRSLRIALRLLQTSRKHSNGVNLGYEKRVNHDLIVPKMAFQNRYISLKKKYSSKLVNEWVESTDPKKHVFEDLAIAAFLIELWQSREGFKDKDQFEFRDLGCGNGLLVYILNMEGYTGKGIDARSRKSWATFPQEVQDNLLEQIVIPDILLKPHPAVSKIMPDVEDNGRVFQINNEEESSRSLLESSQVCTTSGFPKNTFIIGNHSDELTCWIPLLGFPFIVIPCCSHALTGLKKRYNPKKKDAMKKPKLSNENQNQSSSTYGTLVDHVEELSKQIGWETEKEMLRIPSTRNAAIVGITKRTQEAEEIVQTRVIDILALEGGADGWVENSMALMKKAPRNH